MSPCDLNRQKDDLKTSGLWVDGKFHKVEFTGGCMLNVNKQSDLKLWNYLKCPTPCTTDTETISD